MEAFKHCRTCGYQLYLSAFGVRKDSHDGLRSECKECNRARRKKWRDSRVKGLVHGR